MSDDPLPELEPIDQEHFLPFEEGADEGFPIPQSFGPEQFLYDGRGLSAEEFTRFVQDYQFGPTAPDYIVLHHTAVPSTLQARFPQGAVWDAGEEGLSEAQIYRKRQKLLEGIRNYYQRKLNWDRGPHLFIDDRYIWLFTPLRDMGIHAARGNAYRDNSGFHYSIGIEVVGYYEHVQWPEPVARLVGHAVAVLKQRLDQHKPIELRHASWAGAISSHRDYNKPQCPGAAITEQYYLGVLQQGWDRLMGAGDASRTALTIPITDSLPILGPATGRKEQAVSFIKAQLPGDSEYQQDVEIIMSYYWLYAPRVNVDPFLAASQCIFETDALRSRWAGRPRRNPAGLGVQQEGGLSFATWDAAVQAHLGQLLALALTDAEADAAQREMMRKNPRHDRIGGELRGTARTIAGLNNRWTNDPHYAGKLVARMQAIRNTSVGG